MVMERIEAKARAARIGRSEIPLDETPKFATQIAGALDYVPELGRPPGQVAAQFFLSS